MAQLQLRVMGFVYLGFDLGCCWVTASASNEGESVGAIKRESVPACAHCFQILAGF